MEKNKLINEFKKRAKLIELNRKDQRFIKVIALFKAKSLLDTTLNIKPKPRNRVKIKDVLWAARNVEPRIIEVLPAAILHFPKNFIEMNQAPELLLRIIKCIEANLDMGPDFEGIEYRKMKYWANVNLRDKRTKPSLKKKLTKVFRLRIEILQKLKELVAGGKFSNQTAALEAAVMRFKP
jgi:hypothetical protein